MNYHTVSTQVEKENGAGYQWLTPVILVTQVVDKDQEDQGSKPAWANSWQDHISKKPITKKGW
jgi:hypothetical protein